MRLTESDSGFLYSETASGPMQTAAISVLDGVVPFERIYEHIEARLHLVPSFRKRLAWVPMNLAHPKWVDDPEFDLRRHVVAHELPQGTSMTDAVAAIVELNEGLMDRSRPLWKYVVVSGVPDRTLLLTQIHHALIDGASGVHLSTIICDFQADAPAPEPPREPWQPAPLPGAFELAAEAMRESAESFVQRNPMRIIQRDAASNALVQRGVETLSRFVTQPAITAPWNSGLVGPKRKLRWFVREFAELREVRRAFRGTINDVILTAVTEGAARYLESHGEITAGQYLRLMCPVNVRTEDDEGGIGNRVSAMFPRIPAWSMLVTERLSAISDETARLKNDQEAQALTLMQESGFNLPPTLMAPLQLVGTAFDPTAWQASNPPPIFPGVDPRPPFYGFNFTCTNVPAVQVPQYVAGHEILEITSIMMLSGTLGYGVAVSSYNQKMLFSFTAESRLLPDLEQMTEAVEKAYLELLAAAREHNTATASATKIEETR